MRTIATNIASLLLFISLFLVVGSPAANAISLTGLLAHYRLEAHRLGGLDVLLDHRPEDGCLTLVEHVGMHLVARWMVPVAVLGPGASGYRPVTAA
jgi:hypothetical protein